MCTTQGITTALCVHYIRIWQNIGKLTKMIYTVATLRKTDLKYCKWGTFSYVSYSFHGFHGP